MNLKLTALLILIGTPGLVAVHWLALPRLVDAATLQVPLQTLQIAGTVQGLLLLSLAAWLGTVGGRPVGLQAPVLSAVVCRGPAWGAWRAPWAFGVAGGLLGAALIVAGHALAPAGWQPPSLPLAVRLLYGGITEEILLRWGLMTSLAWAGWRVFQRGRGPVADAVMWLAIALSALLFGLSHLPAIHAAPGEMPLRLAAHVTLVNSLFGLVTGFLFWRRGLEAAILAHATAHLLAAVLH